MSMQLFIPVSKDEGLNILRVKFRPDVVHRDQHGNLTCYTSRHVAQRRALECTCAAAGKREMFLIVINMTTPGIIADLRHERPVERVPLATWEAEDTVSLSSQAQDLLSREEGTAFSLEIVPGTEDFYAATYGGGAPECGAGVGPWR